MENFIVELTLRIEKALEGMWAIFVNGLASRIGSSAGIVLISPTNQRIEHAVYFSFATTSNGAECETFLARIRIIDMAGTTP